MMRFFEKVYSHQHLLWLWEFCLTASVSAVAYVLISSEMISGCTIDCFVRLYAVSMTCLFLFKLKSLWDYDSTIMQGNLRLIHLRKKIIKAEKDSLDLRNAMLDISDQIEGVALWKKNADHEFEFIGRSAIDMLFPGKSRGDIIGKTDHEIRTGIIPCFDFFDKTITQDDLPDIDTSSVEAIPICNMTDCITEAFGKPCKFYEEPAEDLCLLVWKTPLYDSCGSFTGTVGMLINTYNRREDIRKMLKVLSHRKQLRKIDSTPNYYILQYDSGRLNMDRK